MHKYILDSLVLINLHVHGALIKKIIYNMERIRKKKVVVVERNRQHPDEINGCRIDG